MEDRMQGSGLRGWPHLGRLLLLLLRVSGLQAEGESEEHECLLEGTNLTVTCPYNINKYASSLKAWQRVRSQGRLETLVRTETRNEDLNRAQAGRYLLEDYPTEAVIRVTMTRLQADDVGLYQCVILLSPQNPVVLHHRIRLVQCKEHGTYQTEPTPKDSPDLMEPGTHAVMPFVLEAARSRVGSPGSLVEERGAAHSSQVLPVFLIILICGFILNKGLVFSILFVLLRKPWPWASAAKSTPGKPPIREQPARLPALATAQPMHSSRENMRLPDAPL